MSIHDGHRQRLKERFRQEGLDNFDDLYVLELLLFYCIPQKDTNPLAHRLLDMFGSLAGVLGASATELEKVEGVGKNVSTFLTLITQTGRFYQKNRSKPGEILQNIDQCAKFLAPDFYGREQEVVFMLCLDAKCKVLCCKKVGDGSVNSASIPIRRTVEIALATNATTVVLAHNHPSGLAIPSADDIQTTHRIAAALAAVEITLADHIVFGRDDDYVSMVQSQYYNPQDTYSVR